MASHLVGKSFDFINLKHNCDILFAPSLSGSVSPFFFFFFW